MRDQLITRAEFDGITATLTTTINGLTATLVKLTTQMNRNANDNNNKSNNLKKKKHNRGCGPIRVPHSGNNRIIEDSSSSKVEKTDAIAENVARNIWC
jgi:hypothetical protein